MTFWNNPINFIGNWLTGVLTGWRMPAVGATILLYIVGSIMEGNEKRAREREEAQRKAERAARGCKW